MPKETSEEVAAIAAQYINFEVQELLRLSAIEETGILDRLCRDIRTLAASCLSQRSDADD